MASERDLLRRAVDLAVDNAGRRDEPFAALVVRDGHVLATGTNSVVRDADPTAHAEIAAIRAAARRHGRDALRGAAVVSSAQPCPVCRSAAALVGIAETVFAAPAALAAEFGWALPPAAAGLAASLDAAQRGDVRHVETPGASAPFERFAEVASGGGDAVPAIRPVHELRFALTVFDYDAAIGFYRDALRLPVVESWDEPAGRGAVLDAGRATLELLSTDQARLVDSIEVGRDVAGRVRLALEVDDSAAVGERLVEAGADHLGGPVETPWRHRNVRLAAPDGLQLTLFTIVEDEEPDTTAEY